MTKSRKQLIFSVAFLLSGLALWVPTHQVFAPQSVETRATVPTVQVLEAPAQCQRHASECLALDVEGVWEQYSINAQGQHEFMARLNIRADGSAYQASPLELTPNTFPKHAYRSYDHKFQDGTWTFREEWDGGRVGEFFLERQADGSFRGFARLAGYPQAFQTAFVKVGN